MLSSFTRTAVWLLALLTFCAPVHAQSEEEIDKWYERAEKFARRGQWRRAANFYQKIWKAEPDADAASAYTMSLHGAGLYAELDKLTATLLEEDPASRDRLLARVACLRETGRDDEALKVLTEFLSATGKGDMELQAMVGDIHQNYGRDKQAKVVFDGLIERARKVVVKSANDLTGLGRAYQFYRHGGKAAEEALASAQKADKTYLEAYYQLAQVYRKLKVRPTDMNRELKDALEIRPRWPRFLAAQIQACDLRLGQAEGEKRALVEQILRINPRHPDALYYKAMRQLSDARWSASGKTFEKALDVNPNHKPSLSGLAALRYVTHKLDAYEELKKKVLALDPTYGDFYRIVADGLSERRRWDESLVMMRSAVKTDPEDPDLWDGLARYSLYIGKEKEGVEALKKAYDLATYNRVWRSNMMDVMKLLAEKFVTKKTDHFVIKLHKDDAPLLEKIVPRFFEDSWKELAERYAFEPGVPIIVDAFRRQTDFSVRTMGTSGLGALGVCFGPTIMMFIPKKTQRPVNWVSTAHHELAHVFTLQASRGRVPRWLTEGLSTWEEVRRNPSWGRNMEIQLHDAFHNDKILKVLEFDSAFYGPRIIFAYYQGGLASQFIEETWGIEAIRKMLRLYGEDKLTSEVIPEALGVSPQEFDRQFLDFAKKMLAPLKRMPTYDADMIRRCEEEIAEGKNVTENRIKAAWGYSRAGKFIDADAMIKPLLDDGVEDDRLALLLAERAWRGKRRDVARKQYEALMERGFEDYDMTVRMAGLYESEGEDGKAFELWKKAKKQNPWSIDPRRSPYMVLAQRHRAEGRLDAWAEELERYCALVDVAIKPRQELISYYLGLERFDDAARLLRQCIHVQTFNPKLHMQLANVLRKQGKTDECITRLECVLSLKPEKDVEFNVCLTLGRMLLKLDRRDDASYHLTRAVELKPDSDEAKRLLDESERDDR